jgi:hypothetical protein
VAQKIEEPALSAAGGQRADDVEDMFQVRLVPG